MDVPEHPSADKAMSPSDPELEREIAEATEELSAAFMAGTLNDGTLQTEESYEPGSLARGRVANVASQDVLIDLGGKLLGVVPRNEFSDPPPIIGDMVECVVEGLDARGGLIVLSKKKAARAAVWRDMQVGLVVAGKVTGMNRGGLEMDVQGIRAFIPASQADTHFLKDISELIGQEIQAEVTKFDREDENLVLSRRKVLEREALERRERMLEELQPGQTRRGRVRNITDFGAFVELEPGVDGLLHVSDMSWGRITNPAEVVKLDQEIEVQVLKVDRKSGRISLGLKQISANPWENVAERFSPQQRVRGRVVRLADFGAFVELEPGIDGLIPLSEMSWTRRLRHPREALKEGDVVEVAVLSIDAEKHRISLGLKQTEANPWDGVAERYPPDHFVPGKVMRITEFGAFVQLESGLEGLLHISEIAEGRIRAVSDKINSGDEVQVRVLKVDLENQRISLSMRQPTVVTAAEPGAAPPKPSRKRSSPSRGGIDLDWAAGGLESLDPSKYAR
jgi:small subunit ribosomal protein S1